MVYIGQGEKGEVLRTDSWLCNLEKGIPEYYRSVQRKFTGRGWCISLNSEFEIETRVRWEYCISVQMIDYPRAFLI